MTTAANNILLVLKQKYWKKQKAMVLTTLLKGAVRGGVGVGVGVGVAMH